MLYFPNPNAVVSESQPLIVCLIMNGTSSMILLKRVWLSLDPGLIRS